MYGPRLAMVPLNEVLAGRLERASIVERHDPGSDFDHHPERPNQKCVIAFRNFVGDVDIVAGYPRRCWNLPTATSVPRPGSRVMAGLRFVRPGGKAFELIFGYTRWNALRGTALFIMRG